MKKLIIPFLLVVTLIFQSCEETQSPIYDGSQTLAYFADAGSTARLEVEVTESSAQLSTTIGVSTISTTDRTVNVSVVSTSTATANQYSFNGTVTIPANTWGAELVITGNQDGLSLTGDNLILQIDGIDDGGVPSPSTLTVLIVQTCPFTIGNFTGTFSVDENFTSGVNSPNGLSFFFTETYQVELALDPSDTTGSKVILTNSAGFNEYIPDGTVITIDEESGDIIFDAGNPLLAGFRNFAYTDSFFDTCALSFQCSGPLATFGPYQFTFTKI